MHIHEWNCCNIHAASFLSYLSWEVFMRSSLRLVMFDPNTPKGSNKASHAMQQIRWPRPTSRVYDREKGKIRQNIRKNATWITTNIGILVLSDKLQKLDHSNMQTLSKKFLQYSYYRFSICFTQPYFTKLTTTSKLISQNSLKSTNQHY